MSMFYDKGSDIFLFTKISCLANDAYFTVDQSGYVYFVRRNILEPIYLHLVSSEYHLRLTNKNSAGRLRVILNDTLNLCPILGEKLVFCIDTTLTMAQCILKHGEDGTDVRMIPDDTFDSSNIQLPIPVMKSSRN